MHHSERSHSRHYLHNIIISKIKENINETNTRYWTDNDWNMLDSLICIRTKKKYINHVQILDYICFWLIIDFDIRDNLLALDDYSETYIIL